MGKKSHEFPDCYVEISPQTKVGHENRGVRDLEAVGAGAVSSRGRRRRNSSTVIASPPVQSERRIRIPEPRPISTSKRPIESLHQLFHIGTSGTCCRSPLVLRGKRPQMWPHRLLRGAQGSLRHATSVRAIRLGGQHSIVPCRAGRPVS